jgi:hypothetical protein
VLGRFAQLATSVIAWPLNGTGFGLIATATLPVPDVVDVGGAVGVAVGVGAGVGVGVGVGAGAAPRPEPEGTGSLRWGTALAAVGLDSVSPQAAATTRATATNSPRVRMVQVDKLLCIIATRSLRKTRTDTHGQEFAHVRQRLSVTSEVIYRDVHHMVRNSLGDDTDSRTGSGQIGEKLPMKESG